jgi:hypothetical protein
VPRHLKMKIFKVMQGGILQVGHLLLV